MTSSSRRALPWLLSAGAHLLAVGVMALILAAPAQPVTVPGLELSLTASPGPGGEPAIGRPTRARPSVPSASAAASSASASRPVAASDSDAAVRAAGAALSGRPPSSAIPTGVPAPSSADVLSDVAAVAAGPGGAPNGSPVGATGFGGSSFGWRGQPRTLIRRPAPEFPAVLSAAGQEIEGEASITVAPSGAVTRVEITRSSGYIEIDASVEEALRGYLFSRVDGRADSIGTVQFRFRLEKQD